MPPLSGCLTTSLPMSTHGQSEELPESPCTGNCNFDEGRGHCLSCFRALREITGWSRADAQQRREILANCQARRERYQEHLLLTH